MSKSQNEDLLTAWVKVGLILMLVITILMMFIATVDSNTKGEASIGSFGTKDFNEGWLLTQNDITNTVSLPAYVDSSLGDEIIISNTLPSNIPLFWSFSPSSILPSPFKFFSQGKSVFTTFVFHSICVSS